MAKVLHVNNFESQNKIYQANAKFDPGLFSKSFIFSTVFRLYGRIQGDSIELLIRSMYLKLLYIHQIRKYGTYSCNSHKYISIGKASTRQPRSLILLSDIFCCIIE